MREHKEAEGTEKMEWKMKVGTPGSEEEEMLHGITDIIEGTAAHGGPTSEQRKSVRKRKSREKLLCLGCNPACAARCLTDGTACKLWRLWQRKRSLKE